MLTAKEIDRLVHRIVERIQPQKVMVFGSYAKGTATAKSDLDLLVIKETDVPREHRADDLKPLLYRFIHVDLLVYTSEEVEEIAKEELSLMRSILKTGKVVYEAPP